MPSAHTTALPHLDISAHEAWFTRYVAHHRTGVEEVDGPMRLKLRHSLNVLTYAREAVLSDARFTPPLARAALLAALYHDIARFPQYRRWRTFADHFSTNHARLGSRILNQLKPLHGEPRKIRFLAQGAVILHNRLTLPARLKPDQRLVADLLRECDRLDILHIMADLLSQDAAHVASLEDAAVLHLPEVPDAYSKAIFQDVLAGRMARYSDLRCRNDFRLLLFSWVQSFSFASIRKSLAASGLLQPLFDNLPDLPEMERIKEAVLAKMAE